LNELALFAGAGGGILGGHLLGWKTVCAVEWEQYPASVLCARQNDGLLPPFPIWDDVQTFDGVPWRGIIDVVSGGFPCQDISVAGNGDGLDGERSGMWREMARIICEVQPRFVFVENSPMLTSRGLGRVLGDLASMGFNARWGVLGAADVGANHQRDRIWIVAKWGGQLPHAQHNRIRWWKQQQKSLEEKNRKMANACNEGLQRHRNARVNDKSVQQEKFPRIGAYYGSSDWWKTEPNVGRVADGVAARVDRLKAIGNGQVPLCAATAWRILSETL
jgi:DNA (cytosine-5)-methyltransferase 1